MAGTFGYELDPAKMTDEERREIRKQIVEYKKYAQLVQNGLYYRLSNPFAEEIGAWEFVSEDGKEVLVNVVMLEIHGNMTVNYVKMKANWMQNEKIEILNSQSGNYSVLALGTCSTDQVDDRTVVLAMYKK